jgi:hypothetical protein
MAENTGVSRGDGTAHLIRSHWGSFLPAFRRSLPIVLAVLALAAPASAARPAVKRVSLSNLTVETRPFRDAVLTGGVFRLVRRPTDTGGVYTTKDGVQIHVNVSSSYQPDQVAPQAVADFFDSLLHGSELGKITVNIRTLAETQAVCGIEALACYDPRDLSMYVPGEDSEGVALEQILAHEYGHHVAASRNNAPWPALALGPKYWASYENICYRAVKHQVYPGDEGDHYTLNPGEGWAETYRLLNARRVGTWPDIGWPIVDTLFYPDDTALQLAEKDVLRPWTGPTVKKTIRGKLRRNEFRRWTLHPSLDGGPAVASVRGKAITAFFDASNRQISPGAKRSSVPVCGDRLLQVAVQGTGRFTLSYSLP